MTPRTITEPERAIDILDEMDVLVAGAGTAGVTAAVSAARAGAKMMLIERQGFLGGVAFSCLTGPWECPPARRRRLGGLYTINGLGSHVSAGTDRCGDCVEKQR